MEKVAKISKLYGSEGEAVLNLLSTFPESIALDEPIFIKVNSLNVPLYFEKFERRGRTGAIVKFADIDTERRITEFVGADLLLAQEDEDVSDEFFMEDLIGFQVEIITDNEPLRALMLDYIDNDINPLFEIQIDEREVLIPAVEEFIHSIDFDNHIIRFSLPEGLIEL